MSNQFDLDNPNKSILWYYHYFYEKTLFYRIASLTLFSNTPQKFLLVDNHFV